MLGCQVGEVLLLVERQARRLALAHHDHRATDAGAGRVQGLKDEFAFSCLFTFSAVCFLLHVCLVLHMFTRLIK